MALLTLTLLEIVLGLALGGRVAMVLGVSWLLSLEHPLFSVFGREMGVCVLIIAIAVMLILEGVGEPIDRTIVYVAILFAVGVEYLNYRRRRHRAGPQGAEGSARGGRPAGGLGLSTPVVTLDQRI